MLTYSEERGWTGGDSRTLYAVIDVRTRQVQVRDGGGLAGVGPTVEIRVATRAEAEASGGWPTLGWTVQEAPVSCRCCGAICGVSMCLGCAGSGCQVRLESCKAGR